MSTTKQQRKLASALIAVGLLTGCEHINYHSVRADPVPVGMFTNDFACDLAVDAVKRRVAVAEREKLDLKSVRDTCAARQDEAQAVALDAQEELRSFVRRTLPDEWFRDGHVRRDPPQLRAHVEVTARSTAAEPRDPPKPFATSLSDRGQQALIEVAARQRGKDGKPVGVGDVLGVLQDRGPSEPSTGSFDTRRSIPLLISTSFNSNRPSDRLEKVYIFIQPLGGSQIVDIDKVTIEALRGKVDLGKEVTTQEITPNFVVEGLTLGDKATGKGGVAAKFGRTLDRQLSRQFAQRTVSLNADRRILLIRQEGQEGSDVTGSVVSTIALQLPLKPGMLSVFSVEKGDKTPKVTMSPRAFVNVGDVEAAVTWVALTRVVKAGSHTITEEDDEVEPWVFARQFKTRLWSNELVLYTLRLKHAVGGRCRSVPLMYEDDNQEQKRLMVFRDFASLERFKSYLRTREYRFAPGSRDTSIDVDTSSGKLRIGFPIAADGSLNSKVLNVGWAPDGNSQDTVSKRMQSLVYDMSEPSYFPLKDSQPDIPCE